MPYPPSDRTIGSPFIELQTIDSTNNYALTQVHAGLAQHGMAIFTHEQTAGKGQRGKKWASSPGGNIALSIIINPSPLRVTEQFQLSACIALALYYFFEKYAGEETKIKWPNDLYWKDRKAGGVLIENVIRGNEPATDSWSWAVIGTGININQTQFPAELPNPVSLKQITGKTFDPVLLAKELCVLVEQYFKELTTNGFGNILSLYLSHFYKKDETVKFKKDTRVFEAVIKGVSPDGKLIVQHSLEEQFIVGEVEWLIG